MQEVLIDSGIMFEKQIMVKLNSHPGLLGSQNKFETLDFFKVIFQVVKYP